MPSSIAVMDRRQVPEVAKRPQRLAFKAAEQADSANGTMLAVDEHEGIVTAIVSVTGCEDEVADIIVPGAYRDTLVKRRPKVCWAHSWEQPIGRVLDIEELLPGDPRLPKRQRDGKAWPTEAGALVATMQFNLYSTKGKEAFAAVLFYSETGECEYSIGYQARKAFKDKAGVRHIKSLDLFELSVVLFGAHTMTGTLSIKDATAGMHAPRISAAQRVMEIQTKSAAATSHTPPQGVQSAAAEGLRLRKEFGRGGTEVGVARARDLSSGKGIPDETLSRMVSFFARHEPDKSADGWGSKTDPSAGYVAWLLWGGDAGAAWAKSVTSKSEAKALPANAAPPFQPKGEQGTSADTPDKVSDDPGSEDDDKGQQPDFSDGVMIAVYPDAGAADKIAEQIAGPDVTTERDDLHVTLAYLGTVGDVGDEATALVRIVTEAIEGMPQLQGEVAGIGMFPASGDTGVPTWAPVDVPGLGLLREQIVAALGEQVSNDHGFTPHMTLGYNIGLTKPLDAVPVTFDKVRVVFGTQQYDITLGQTVQAGGTKMLLDMNGYLDAFTDADWWDLVANIEATDTVDEHEAKVWLARMESKARTPGGREGDASPVGTPGGKQNWVDKAGGLPRYIRMVAHALIRQGKSKSRAIAIAVATMKRWAANAGGKVTAKVQAAAAQALAEWEAMKASTKKSAYDPSLEGKMSPAAAADGYPYLDGTMEQHLAAVRSAVSDLLRGEEDDDGRPEWDMVDIVGTWENVRLIARRTTWHGGDRTETYEIPYEMLDGIVHLGDQERVTLQVVAVTDDGEEEADVSVADTVPMADEVNRLTAILAGAHAQKTEGKAGRVLSGRNERNLREAVVRMIEVLEGAGVRIILDDDERRAEERRPADSDEDSRREMDPDVDVESTSPSANRRAPSSKSLVVDMDADLQRLLADPLTGL